MDGEANTIEIGIEADATGWIALGISPLSTMPNSDIAIGWVENGAVYLQDRYTVGRSAPLYDDEQNLELIEGEEANGRTRIRFKRTKYLCSDDDEHDLSLGEGTTRLIWAFHATEDPSQEMWDANSISMHTNFGSQSINFESGVPSHVELPDDVQYLDITMDEVAVPDSETTYWCALMKIPASDSTRYVLRSSALLQEGHESLVHHITAYACDPDDDVSDAGWEGVCTDANMPSKHCRGSSVIFGWAVGGNDWAFPEDTHLELEHEFVMVEMHYDNPEMRSDFVDSSGFRMYWTETPQAMAVGFGGVALHAFADGLGQWIPGGLSFAHNAAFTPSECTEGLPEEGVQVFATFLHQHTIGAALSLRHFRDGVELEPLDVNMDYDFNYQQYIYHDEPRTILPGDSLIIDCWVDSSNRSQVTVAGESSRQEMCSAGFMYYPRYGDEGLGVGSMVWKTEDALMEWASDAQELGYLTGDVEAINETYFDEFFYLQNFPNLTYDSAAEGAAEFYERLWSADYAQYNEHYVTCFDGTFLIDEPIFDDFVPYEATSYCEEDNDNAEDEDYDESAAPGSNSAWPLLFALSLFFV